MEIEITGRKDNPLLDREEIDIEIDHVGEATPSTSSLVERLAAEENVDPLTIDVEHIYSQAGRNFSSASVKIYEEPVREEMEEENVEEERESEEGSEEGTGEEESVEEPEEEREGKGEEEDEDGEEEVEGESSEGEETGEEPEEERGD